MYDTRCLAQLRQAVAFKLLENTDKDIYKNRGSFVANICIAKLQLKYLLDRSFIDTSILIIFYKE